MTPLLHFWCIVGYLVLFVVTSNHLNYSNRMQVNVTYSTIQLHITFLKVMDFLSNKHFIFLQFYIQSFKKDQICFISALDTYYSTALVDHSFLFLLKYKMFPYFCIDFIFRSYYHAFGLSFIQLVIIFPMFFHKLNFWKSPFHDY